MPEPKEEQKEFEKEVIAKCKQCFMKFDVWISDDKTCPECEGEIEFNDCREQILQELDKK